MRIADCDIVFIAGQRSLTTNHWMDRWGKRFPNSFFVDLADAGETQAHYQDLILKTLKKTSRPIVFVTSEIGAYVLAHALPVLKEYKILGAFIVNPPDITHEHHTLSKSILADYPKEPFPFPTLFVASSSDENASLDHAETVSSYWNAKIVDAGDSGSLDEDSGHGPWPEGLMSFAGFLKKL